MVMGSRGQFGGAAPRKFLVTKAFRLPENEGNALFKTNYFEKLL